MVAFGRLGAVVVAVAAGACSVAAGPEMELLTPDAGSPLAVGCKVTVEYPASSSEVVVDELFYDTEGRLIESLRQFGDGTVSEREWSYAADGTATREWFDGSKKIRFDEAGRVIATETYNSYDGLEWVEDISYTSDGRIANRLITRMLDSTPWMQTSYQWDGELSGLAEVASLVYEDDRRLIGYHTAPDGQHTKLVESHDIDADGVIDFKTAVLIDADGVVLRGVDERNRLIDFEYEGDDCVVAASLWQLGNPFLIEL